MKTGPGTPKVTLGSTRHTVVTVATVASARTVPSALKWAMRPPLVAKTSEMPMIPFAVIITAANTVSRAREAVSSPPLTMRVRISPTSMTVTATASRSEPNGSPTRWPTTSVCWTAASTAPTSRAAARTATTPVTDRPHVTTRTSAATTGRALSQRTTGCTLRPAQSGRD